LVDATSSVFSNRVSAVLAASASVLATMMA